MQQVRQLLELAVLVAHLALQEAAQLMLAVVAAARPQLVGLVVLAGAEQVTRQQETVLPELQTQAVAAVAHTEQAAALAVLV